MPPSSATGRRPGSAPRGRARGRTTHPTSCATWACWCGWGRLGRAHELRKFFMHDRRPEGWNQWAEVVLPNPREPRFLGDMPHAWVASDYLRSVLAMFAWEREEGDAPVLGAGLSEEWMASGVAVKNMSTAQGPLSYAVTP